MPQRERWNLDLFYIAAAKFLLPRYSKFTGKEEQGIPCYIKCHIYDSATA
jgi:hypothetical protein